MPIKNLTTIDPAVDTAFAFTSLGKLRKGGAKQGNQFGPELDYWRFVALRPEVQQAYSSLYGQTAVVECYLPYAQVDDCFSTWREQWAASSLVVRCDGEHKHVWKAGDKIVSGNEKCGGNCAECKAKPVGRLAIILPELWKAGHIGYVTMETHSINDIRNIWRALQETYRWQVQRGGEVAALGLRGIRFTLRRAKVSISTPRKDGSRAMANHSLVFIEPTRDWAQLRLEAANKTAMLALPPGGVVVDAESRVIDTSTGQILEGVKFTEEEGDDEGPWQQDPELRQAFQTMAESFGLGQEDVIAALQVPEGKRISDVKCTYEQAIEMLMKHKENLTKIEKAVAETHEEKAVEPVKTAEEEEVPF